MITKKDVEHVAKLAQLELSDSEKETLTKQLGDILKFVEKLGELNTDGVEPTYSVIPVSNVTRADAEKPSFTQDEALANAPEKDMGFFKIPKIME